MKRSIIISILTLTLFLGMFSAPATAYNSADYNQRCNSVVNSVKSENGNKIIFLSHKDMTEILLKFNKWCVNIFDKINGQEPEQPVPEEKPEQPAPEEEPEQPAPEEEPEQPAPEEEPEQPAPEEEPEQPAPEEKPEQPAPEEEPEQPAPEEEPEQPAPEEEPEQPAPEEKPEQPAPEEEPEQPAPEEKPEQPTDVSGQQGQMLDMVNAERIKAGLKPLTWDANLAKVAQDKAKDMVDNNYFDHNSPSYGSPFDMMKKYGITYRAAGENLAGSSNVEKAHTGLMNSDGHRKNILNSNFTHMGIGVEKSPRYGYVYVQMFIGK